MQVKVTRFAPSPTGLLHLGGLRTCLFNYLLARKSNGRFLLRIEDTDTKRLFKNAIPNLISNLNWLNLNFDNQIHSIHPSLSFIQSHRSNIYKSHSEILLKNGHAYHCFCTQERIENVRNLNRLAKNSSSYDRKCLNLSKHQIDSNLASNIPFTIRLKIPRIPKITLTDLIHGNLEFSSRSLDDMILIKSDGLPTYHLANVVDDHLMGVTHVLRGEEWIPSTPAHIVLYTAFGWKPPAFAHLPLLVKEDGSKLSKRQNDVHLDYFKENGYLPEALLNFVALLGWSPGAEAKEMYTIDELIENFNLSQVNKSSAVVSFDKLDYLNKLHIAHQLQNPNSRSKFCALIKDFFIKEYGKDVIDELQSKLSDDEYFNSLIDLVHNRCRVMTQFSKLLRPFFCEPNHTSQESIEMLSTFNLSDIYKAKLYDLFVDMNSTC
ncbi:tRNA synthetases class I, catalytic domain-containing protein [Globomyces pollinis-pini]|nr:tRNA synthetases class I, catalytic domain-containing protein [Globomyces pollinis-pini]